MSFSERLNYAMKMAGHTQGSLAKAVGMAQSSVWKLVSGQANSSRKTVEIANVLGIRPEWLTTGKGEMRADDGKKSSPPKSESLSQDQFRVAVYNGSSPTGEELFIPIKLAADTSRAYYVSSNTGCSMVPANTYIVVDSAETASDGDLVYAKSNGSYSVYNFVQGGKFGYLSVDDPRVPLLEIGKETEVLGVVVFLSRIIKQR
ncbi:helix-turn-helix domain-containing protein [Serratia sp. 1D1416]|uniref:helix-turn-helix domain-containing protein n=1 Tax=Serratia sp. 1D1416 TaxID=2447890 RepID=UPI001013CA0B|nr:S24 family peptidase [Serratia sp. 1D1416]